MESEKEEEMMPLSDREIDSEDEFPESFVDDPSLDSDYGPDNSDEGEDDE